MSALSSKRVLFALAIGAFGIGTTEFAPMGLLPVIAEGVNASIPTAGMLVTAYAIGVMVGAPIMTLLFSRFGKRAALMMLMSIFTVGNLLSALSPDYYTLLASRLITSLNHGAFFGLGAVVAASVVPKDKQASAIATMFMGLTIANIGGVPAATWIGQQIGWRMAFAGTAVLGLIAISALWYALPKGERGSVPHVRKELAVIARPSVLLAMATTVLGAGAMFTLYTYVAPVLAELTGASNAFVTLGLVLIGVGFTIGNNLGGRLADWSLDGAARIFLGTLAVIMLLMPLVLGSHVGAALALLVWGVFTFAVVPPLQMRVMIAAAEAPGLASSINVGAFNLGNAVGAALGGAVISLDLGYAAVPMAGGLLAATALLLVWLGGRNKVANGTISEAL
ncbi:MULTISPECIES: MFS transporter [unclassified Pseudomonas]|uniref:MFS transporter n=1 Tax=unclassified Pseudomonas TaxID=196821 RepID=UPI001645F84B|nr:MULTISPECIES: MFS transporter [unclassified Pseudomonas]MBC3419722.1 MFS transporter [Pseudomonas sp. RW3S2]MBC3464390.1 MFS transporter [Pseudomonas sp. RW10S2]QXI41441.1 MFS transporter [Pseudomonas wayambapalatensis]